MPAGIEDLLIIALPSAVSRIDQDALFGPWEGGTGKLPESNPFDSPVTMGNHLHPHPEMCLLLAGRCRLTYGKRSLAVPEGSLVLLPGNLRHGETFSQAGEPYSLAWWILPPAKPVFQVTAYGPEAGFSVINRIPLDGMGHEMDASLERLQAIVEKKHPPALIELKEALLTMVLLLMRQLALFGTELDQQGQVVRMALTYIEENLNRPIDLGEVGREVHLSPNYLTSLFRRYTGYSMGHMIRRLRVQRACTLLEDPRRQIQEIAREVGIPDPFTFSKVFRSVQGESPTRYRKRLRFVKSDRHS
ncbi:MAG TPA: AraC family transcriptional regulator [Oceanipulchritudo sp.]|nr:AraC family transcriptional regulator [Oceanipulchritudo sp.]